MDIKLIPEAELRKDLKDSQYDIELCKTALDLGITSRNGYSIETRVRTNVKIIMVIEAELARRVKEGE